DFYENLSKLCADILQLPLLTVINPPTDPVSQLQIISLMKNYSLRARDAYHLLIMQSNDIEAFATFDTDFRRVFAAKILKKI
ncbi:type II toxin-antitoxin system VapC family toxin, partial [Candidatus Gottesmanbacteria bacterium]|nr:type II toxin-antitoxin system VapC family toxin [Candidatus Gottesmanbacteria bacterium]